MSNAYTHNHWEPHEDTFLEMCSIISVPYERILENLEHRTPVSITKRVHDYGLVDIRQMHKEYTIQRLYERHIENTPIERDEFGIILWNCSIDSFIRKCFYLKINYQTIAKTLGISYKAVRRRVLNLKLRDHRDKFYIRYARFYYHIYCVNQRSLAN